MNFPKNTLKKFQVFPRLCLSRLKTTNLAQRWMAFLKPEERDKKSMSVHARKLVILIVIMVFSAWYAFPPFLLSTFS